MKKLFFQFIFSIVVLTGYGNSFITTWKTDNPGISNSTSITIPTAGGGFNYDVDWDNDGVFDEMGITGSVTHDFATAGTYTIRIQGAFPRIFFNNTGDCKKILAIEQWGDGVWNSMYRSFYGCSNLVVNAVDAPNLTLVTSMRYMFASCSSFDQSINHWDVSNVTDMNGLFLLASTFNQPLNNWSTSNVTDMVYMFAGSTMFNQDINDWDVSQVTSMAFMFNKAKSFNQDLDQWVTTSLTNTKWMFANCDVFNGDVTTWNVGNVVNMSQMFWRALVFNQNINTWDVGNVVDMFAMFRNAYAFNQDLNSWDVQNVTTMKYMFYSATSFNGDISLWQPNSVTNMSAMFAATPFNQDISYKAVTNSWNVSQVTAMGAMFSSAQAFNQDIGNWDVSNVNNMSSMFKYAVEFNQDIGNWDTGEVESMANMFNYALKFNQPIDNWDVSSVLDMQWMFYKAEKFNQSLNSWSTDNVVSMYRMFYRAYQFDQNLGDWNISAVTNMKQMFSSTPISTLNYDLTLIGWLNSFNPSNITQLSGANHFCLGADAHSILDAVWGINDQGLECPEFRPTYVRLKKQLDGGYYSSVDDKIYFEYLEEYFKENNSILTYNIYNSLQELESSISISNDILSQANVVKVGVNLYSMDVSGLTSGDYYILEVVNSKNEKKYLRFKA